MKRLLIAILIIAAIGFGASAVYAGDDVGYSVTVDQRS